MPLWIHIDKNGWIHLAQKFDSKESKEEGNYLEYETGKDSIEDNGVYIDRAYIYKLGILKYIIKRGWELEAVSGKTNTYRLYTYSNTSHLQRHHLNLTVPSITSSQPRHKAMWTETAMLWKKETKR